jgi:hypothetical protein
LEFFRHDQNVILSRLVTMDETWLYHYDPEIEQESKECGIAVHPALPQKIPSTKSAGKVPALIFFGSRRFPPH